MGRITDGAQKPRPMIIKFRNQGIKNLELENSLIAALITVIAPLHRKKGLTIPFWHVRFWGLVGSFKKSTNRKFFSAFTK